MMVITVILIVQQRNASNAVILSLALSEVMCLGDTMTRLIHRIGLKQTFMVSIKWCIKLLEVPQEKQDQPKHHDQQWPLKGEIEMKNLNLRYSTDAPLTLNNCSFKISSGEKIGVVGRTGAGKSTLCNAFTRIVEKESGSIYLDGIDISKVNLRQVRESITIVP